jgi:hypothetical protein
MRRHSAQPIRNYIKQVAVNGVAQARLMISGWHWKTAAHNHSDLVSHLLIAAAAAADFAVAVRTEHIESFVSAIEEFAGCAMIGRA